MENLELETSQYQPVVIPESPVNRQKGNLTGPPRIVQDSAADLHNYIQEWNGYYLNGVRIISQICNLKMSQCKTADPTSGGYPQGLQEVCYELQDVYNKMEAVVDNMKEVNIHFEGVMKLYEMKNIHSPVFTTWRIQDYVDLSKVIYEMYKKELKMKLYIKENIGHAKSEENILFYQTVWVQQPYIEYFEVKIEAMLKETNLRI